MRVANNQTYFEPRDAIAHDWYRFMQTAFKETPWLLIPNGLPDVSAYLNDWGINAIILSGGDDIGIYPVRDETENQIIGYAQSLNIPIFGVCRGLQILISNFGGKFHDKVDERHVASHHNIKYSEYMKDFHKCPTKQVNSYHKIKIIDSGRLLPLAYDDDGFIEAAFLPEHNFLGVMWHPERCDPFDEADISCIRNLFKKGL